MSTHAQTEETLELHAADGTPLQAHLYRPAAGIGRPVLTAGVSRPVLISGGLGIPQRFYLPFARWLAGRGYLVMTFDLRGMGESRRPEHRRSLRGLQADMLTWARQDFAAAVARLHDIAQGAPVAVVGHSLGMHHAAMTDAATQARIDLVVSVAAGSGYWRDWAAPSRRLAPLMLHLAAPVLTPVLGYFPGKALRMVGDLPGPAVRQWTRWCRHPGFAWGAQPELILPPAIGTVQGGSLFLHRRRRHVRDLHPQAHGRAAERAGVDPRRGTGRRGPEEHRPCGGFSDQRGRALVAAAGGLAGPRCRRASRHGLSASETARLPDRVLASPVRLVAP